jgi:hypothetical protein
MNRKAKARLAARKKASRPDRFIEDGYSHWKFSKGKSASPESKIENVEIPDEEISQSIISGEEDEDEDLSANIGGVGSIPVAHSDPTLVADFDPSQTRDKGGKWSKEGGSGGEGFPRKTLAGISDKFRGEVLDYVKKQGWNANEFEHRLDHEVHRHKNVLAARSAQESSTHEQIVKDVMGQVMSQMRTEARQKEAEDFKKLRSEKLAQPVLTPASTGPSTAQVQILSKRTPAQVEEHVKKVLGEHATMQDVASLAGAAHGAVVTVSPGKGASSLTVRVKHPDYVSKRTIYKDENGNLVLHNDEFFMKPGSTGKGLGAEVFGRQVEHAQRLGVSHIETLAGGPPAMNGYYTWPRFGYDQHLDSLALMSGRYGDQKIRAAREKFPGVESVSDIFLHHGGAEWWKTNGLAMPEATFDLKSGSRSLKVWHTYLAEKATSRPRSEPVGHSSQLAEDIALMVNVNPRYDPLDHEVDDIGNGEENYDSSPEVESALDTTWEKLRKELNGKSPVAHFDPSQARDAISAEEMSILINSGELDINAICRDSHGRFASCGAAGLPPAERSGASEARMVHARHLVEQVRGAKTPDAATVKALADHLGTLTVAQLHSLKKEYGLKASGKNKAALKEKLTARFSQKSTTATPSAPKVTETTLAPSSTPPGPVHVPVGTFGTTKDIKWGHPDDEAYAHEVAQKVLGPNARAHDLLSIAGAPDGSTAEYVSHTGTSVEVWFKGSTEVKNPTTGEKESNPFKASRTLTINNDGTKTIDNGSFEGKGSGLQMFGRQVENATKWGFTHIETYAAGEGSGVPGQRPAEGEYNGYYTWPRFGYNGTVHRDLVEEMPPSVRRNVNEAEGMISGVMSTKAGRDWWMGHGEGMNMEFDLTPGSYSQDTLNTYLRHRGVLR